MTADVVLNASPDLESPHEDHPLRVDRAVPAGSLGRHGRCGHRCQELLRAIGSRSPLGSPRTEWGPPPGLGLPFSLVAGPCARRELKMPIPGHLGPCLDRAPGAARGALSRALPARPCRRPRAPGCEREE